MVAVTDETYLAFREAYLALRIEGIVSLALWYALLAVKLFAFGDSILHRGEMYVAADKQNKMFWLLLLGVFLMLHLIFGSQIFFNLIGTVAAVVYLVDVRPTLRALRQP